MLRDTVPELLDWCADWRVGVTHRCNVDREGVYPLVTG